MLTRQKAKNINAGLNMVSNEMSRLFKALGQEGVSTAKVLANAKEGLRIAEVASNTIVKSMNSKRDIVVASSMDSIQNLHKKAVSVMAKAQLVIRAAETEQDGGEEFDDLPEEPVEEQIEAGAPRHGMPGPGGRDPYKSHRPGSKAPAGRKYSDDESDDVEDLGDDVEDDVDDLGEENTDDLETADDSLNNNEDEAFLGEGEEETDGEELVDDLEDSKTASRKLKKASQNGRRAGSSGLSLTSKGFWDF